jgi:murein DD-endopeptidase MepM/ murein hydrolase activator NlpD
VGAATVVVLVVGLLVALVMYPRVAAVASRARALELENETLRRQNERVVNLKTEIDRLRTLEAKILTLMGIDTLGLSRHRYQETWPDSQAADSLGRAGSREGFRWPVRGAISRGYRPEADSGSPHLGLDIAGRTGVPVKAALSGKVAFAGVDSIFGNMVVIDHGDSLTTIYGHNSQLLVHIGDIVSVGQAIARLGNTGRSSAPHLHFEVRKGDSSVDPLKYLETGR